MSFPRPRSCSRSRLGGGAETPGLPAGHPPSFLSGAGSATTSWLSACAGSGACAISWCSSGRARGGADLHSSRKAGTTFHYHREQSVYVNPFYEEDFGPIFFKVCSCAALEPEALLEWAGEGRARNRESPSRPWTTLSPDPQKLQPTCDRLGPEAIDRLFRNGGSACLRRKGNA